MIDALFHQTGYLAAKKMLDATALRQEAIAANIANVETPGYQRVDLAGTFQEQLRQAIGSANPTQLANVQPQLIIDPLARAAGRDGNNVQLETELFNLQQNALNHSVGTQLVTGALLKLQLAITGRIA